MMMTNSAIKYITASVITLLASASHADGSPVSSISIHNYDLINQLKNCAENAVNQGYDTVEDISIQCDQEIAPLDAAVPGLSENIINSVLN